MQSAPSRPLRHLHRDGWRQRLVVHGILGLFAAAFLRPAQGALLTRDLGQGLRYYRVHSLPADLPTGKSEAPGACILDIRFARGDAAAAAALDAWVRFNASPKTPVFLLANPETSEALLNPFSDRVVSGLVILGPGARDFEPDIALPITLDQDRRAYEALEHGKSLDSLLTDNPGKPRMDEALLEKEHLSDSSIGDDDTQPPANDHPEPPPLIDAVLQRAVQLDRALLALRRI